MRSALFLVVTVAVGCGDDASFDDASIDAASIDAASIDAASIDAATDTATDAASSDASSDGGRDAATDGGTDGGADAASDAAEDASTDAPFDAELPFGLTERVASPCGLPDPAPMSIRGTNCYADLPTRAPAAGLIEYETTSNLWADGTLKRRFLVMPDTTSIIRYTARGAWALPVGTVLIKEFLLETRRGDPSSVRPLETRFLQVTESGTWRMELYRWNAGGTDAMLYDGGTQSFAVTEPGGGTSTYTHFFPARGDCEQCHNEAAGQTLGLRTVQMNRDHDYGAVTDNQLRAFDHIGLFGASLPGTWDTLPRMPIPTDASEPLADRARSYLEGNCAHCHLPDGPAGTDIDLRFQTSFRMTLTCGVMPGSGDVGGAATNIITAGNRNTSALWLRMNRRDDQGMPERGSLIVDPFGVVLVGDWIDGLTCP